MSVITCRSNRLRGARELSRKHPTETFYNYVGGSSGAWQVTQMSTGRGEPLMPVTHVNIINGPLDRMPIRASWVLSGLVQNTLYITREERQSASRGTSSEPLPPTCAALIPILYSPEWWELGPPARRELQQSQPMRGLSAMMRRWQYRWDLSEQFDGVTWFEYEPRDSAAFDDLLANWRASEKWKFVQRECDIRLVRAAS